MAKKLLSLEYNSTRDKLKYYEYGRSIQKMVEHAKAIENKEERQATVESIIELINYLNPQTKNVLEYKQKLWRHVFDMADNDLNVEHPFESLPTEADSKLKHIKVNYPQHEFPSRHYGYNIRMMIYKALKMEDGPIKSGFVETILSYMKLSYRTWNSEHFVSDDIIISDLAVMSNKQLSVDDNHTIEVNMKANQPNANQTVFKTTRTNNYRRPNNQKRPGPSTNSNSNPNNKNKRK
jgi:Domain of unknown function (DUF4290)